MNLKKYFNKIMIQKNKQKFLKNMKMKKLR